MHIEQQSPFVRIFCWDCLHLVSGFLSPFLGFNNLRQQSTTKNMLFYLLNVIHIFRVSYLNYFNYVHYFMAFDIMTSRVFCSLKRVLRVAKLICRIKTFLCYVEALPFNKIHYIKVKNNNYCFSCSPCYPISHT